MLLVGVKLVGFLGLFILHNVASINVLVEQGLLEGEYKWTVTGNTLYCSFKGIPYAAPPIGNLRFKAPQPAVSWKGKRKAKVHGSVCPQVHVLTNEYTPGNEDCLFLNVYTPSIAENNLLPVMFFIHGGGYMFGSGNDDNYGPDFLIDENIILVTINYRLDTLGFLCLDSEEVPGNAGMKDQVAALRWVRRNIRKFGGDPNNITIFGQSVGATSCILHALSPMSKGLFHRIISMSGVPISEFAVEFKSKQRAFVLGKNLGYETSNTTELLEFLKTVSVRSLLKTNSSILAAEEFIDNAVQYYFVPVVEKDFGQERFLIEPPEDSTKNAQKLNVDILLGYTTAEGLAVVSLIENRMIKNYNRYPEALVPRNVFYKSTPTTHLKLADSIKEYYWGSKPISLEIIPQFVNYVTDIFNHDVIRYARHVAKFSKNINIYLYQFSSISERNVLGNQGAQYKINGVAHTDELQYIFQAKALNLTVDKNARSYKMIQQTCSLLTNFAKHGNPTPDSSFGVLWPKYNAKSQMYVDIGEKLTLGRNPVASMMKFWRSIYRQAGLLF